MPLATDGGASIWMTRSMAPMSIPSSSDEVATSPRICPAFSLSSISIRCGRASEPWCARTSGSPASSLTAAASRSATRRLFTKMSVDRCVRTSSSSRGWIALQIDDRGAAHAGPLRMSWISPIRAMSSTGTSIVSSSFFFCDVSTMVTGR